MNLRVKTFADELRAVRAARDLSQEDLARALDVSVRTIQNWEAGMTPTRKHRRRIRSFLDEE